MDEGLNIQEYLDSGVLELYVSGTLSEEEVQEVAMLAEKHPEIHEAILGIEETMIQYMEAYAPEDSSPSLSILESVLAGIEKEEKTGDSQEAEKSHDTPVVPLTSSEPALRSSWSRWQWLAAAAVVLLLVSVVLNIFFYREWQETEDQFLALSNERTQLAEENQSMRTRMEGDQALLAHLSDLDSKAILLNGLEISPESRAAVVWNPQTDEVLLASHQLPKPQTGFQYQLWAIVDGTPVSAGVFDHAQANQFLLAVSGEAAAFAITLEKEGGVASPTLEQMYVYGEPA